MKRVEHFNFILDELYFNLSQMRSFHKTLGTSEKASGYKLAIYDMENTISNIKKRFDSYDIEQNQTTIIKENKRNPIPKKIRDFIMKRDKFICVNCGSTKDLEIDHIRPITRGGTDKVSNLQTLCKSCNTSKGNSVFTLK